MATCSVSELVSSACENKFTCVSDEKTVRALILQLLCDIKTNGTGGSGSIQVYTDTYADPATAGLTPDDPTVAAIFYQDPAITLYNEWKWSVSAQAWYQTIAPV